MWYHVSTKPIEDGGRGPKELTGMVDLTRDAHGRTRARLMDLVPGRFRAVVQVVADRARPGVPRRGADRLRRVFRRVQQDIHGHRGRKDDPLYRIRNILGSCDVIAACDLNCCVRGQSLLLKAASKAASGLSNARRRTKPTASAAPSSRSMPASSHSTEMGPS